MRYIVSLFCRFEFEKLVLVLSTARESATKHISERLSHLPNSDLRTPSTPNQQPHTFGSIILGSCVSEMGKVTSVKSYIGVCLVTW